MLAHPFRLSAGEVYLPQANGCAKLILRWPNYA
jgi:hypothetical protein